MQFKNDTHPDRQATIRQFHTESAALRAADDAAGKPGILDTTRKLESLPEGHHVVFGVPIEKINGGYRFADGREEIAAFGAAGSLRRYYWTTETETTETETTEPETETTETETTEPETTETETVTVKIPQHGRARYGYGKFWWKIVTGIKEGVLNGFAYSGEFGDKRVLRDGTPVSLPVGAVILSYGDEKGRRTWPEVGLYVVEAEGLRQLAFSEEKTWATDLLPEALKMFAAN